MTKDKVIQFKITLCKVNITYKVILLKVMQGSRR